jgi:hypothetical protein
LTDTEFEHGTSYRDARTIPEFLDHLGHDSDLPPNLREAINSLDLTALSQESLASLSKLASAILGATRLENEIREGWLVGYGWREKGPRIEGLDHHYHWWHPESGRIRYMAELYTIDGDLIRRLETVASEGWHVWMVPKYSLHFPSLTQVTMIESSESYNKHAASDRHLPGGSQIQPWTEPPPRPEPITFELLMVLQPALRVLRDELIEAAGSAVEGDNEDRVWVYGPNDDRSTGFRARLNRLVGWQAKPDPSALVEFEPRLQTSEAYEVARVALYSILQDALDEKRKGFR